MGKLTAGSVWNVVCESALMEVEVRGQTTDANEYVEAYAIRVAEGAAKMQDCEVSIKRMGSAAAFTCDWALSERVYNICKDALGIPAALLPGIGGGSEDFAYMAERVQKHGGQACYFGILVPCPASNHSDRFDFNEDALTAGAETFTAVTLDLLQSAT